ncbi:ribA/ribD-fused uncharacterized protein [Streptomyces rapamycinicus]|uniref:NADAR domain-containing protein n=2 Tax=Streptomyces rapamycinicus TaxID=1226757 RepID=A0A3L8RR10_STRRN|nr:ribA/ribD-fused uncharacterized protein [Streptomyces rapamycinicus]RLV82305.1 hypothetical protein D3C57_128010 [Streptomyces rapamycinicus NRRL 5491]
MKTNGVGDSVSAEGSPPVSADGAPRSVEELVERAARGDRLKYVWFWGHRPRPDGSVGSGCFSQWWPSPFTVDGVTYATAEHWMMAGKARLFGDAEAERSALDASHPKQAKDAGRAVRGFDEETWRRHRFGLVVEGSVHKFGHPPSCATICRAPGRGCWWRPARWTGCGASGWLRTTSGRRTRSAGAGSICWGSR